jgi:hypothetical protein
VQLDENTFVVNSAMGYKAFCAWVWDEWQTHKYLTFTHRIGEDRSLDQNALFHVWLTEYCAHLAGINKKAVTAGMVEYLKRKVKKAYYRETGFPWMLTKLVNPESGEEGDTIFASSKDYKVGEMFLFLTWLQNHAADDGCLLESRGQYQKLQREQNA